MPIEYKGSARETASPKIAFPDKVPTTDFCSRHTQIFDDRSLDETTYTGVALHKSRLVEWRWDKCQIMSQRPITNIFFAVHKTMAENETIQSVIDERGPLNK